MKWSVRRIDGSAGNEDTQFQHSQDRLHSLGFRACLSLTWSRVSLQVKSELDSCREVRMAQGEFVEPEVFGNALGAIFEVTNWPVYSWANIYNFGTPFTMPRTH